MIENWHAHLLRLTYGVTPELNAAVRKTGFETWVQAQLNPSDKEPDLQRKLDAVRMEIKVKKEKKSLGISTYYATAEELWEVTKTRPIPQFDKRRPMMETLAVTWMRQLYSEWQLREIMVEFWHNHFNVSCETDDLISVLFPIYDREVIRPNCFGNFRTFLEQVAKSPCMLVYLDNAFSKASPANENYARELLELHTLGEDCYVNHRYPTAAEVPKDENGTASGFIDEDIYEIARAFTGWTFGSGKHAGQGEKLPNTGVFHYHDRWHDPYQKHILGKNLPSHQSDMKDGIDVLDLLAAHPGTARFVCEKMCAWLVSDTPPESLISKAVQVWTANLESEDQIKKVVEVIVLSEEFEKGLGSKIKRPNVLLTSLIRATGIDFQPVQGMYWLQEEMGYTQFNWGPPTGHPDDSSYWISSNMLLKRWNAIPSVLYLDAENENIPINISAQTPEVDDLKEIIHYWSVRLLGKAPSNSLVADIEKVWMKDLEAAATPALLRKSFADGYEHKLRQLVSLLAISPEFQKR